LPIGRHIHQVECIIQYTDNQRTNNCACNCPDSTSRKGGAADDRGRNGIKFIANAEARLRTDDWPNLGRYEKSNAAIVESGARPDVVFMGDSISEIWPASDPEFFASNGPFRGIKRDVYEGGIRVPMIAWGPGRIPAGRTSDEVWAMWDVLPTLAALAGVRAPSGIDGISMVPSLTGRGRQRPHGALYWEFYEQGTKQAVRMGRWKGVRQPMITGKLEVYDLQTDPGESRDAAAGNREVAARLVRLLDEAHTPSALWRAPAEQ
jgi:arylsulfatase A-like enzyme